MLRAADCGSRQFGAKPVRAALLGRAPRQPHAELDEAEECLPPRSTENRREWGAPGLPPQFTQGTGANWRPRCCASLPGTRSSQAQSAGGQISSMFYFTPRVKVHLPCSALQAEFA